MIHVKLKPLLKEKNMTMKELHEQTGISMKSLSLFANQRTEGVQYNTLDKIVNVLNVEIGDLIEKVDSVFELSIVENEKIMHSPNKFTFDFTINFIHVSQKIQYSFDVKVQSKINQLDKTTILFSKVAQIKENVNFAKVKQKVFYHEHQQSNMLHAISYGLLQKIVNSLNHHIVFSMKDELFFSWTGSGILEPFYIKSINNELMGTLTEKVIFPTQTFLFHLVPKDPFTEMNNISYTEKLDEIPLSIRGEKIIELPVVYDVLYDEDTFERKIFLILPS